MSKIKSSEIALGPEHAQCYQLDVSGPKKQMLMFPRWNFDTNRGALSVHGAVTRGLINRRTQLLCVERYAETVPHISEQIELLGLTSRTRMHVGALGDVVLKPVERFDFAFFDFGGIPDRKEALWIADDFTKKVVDGADISFGVRYEDDWSELLHTCRLGFKISFKYYAKDLKDFFEITDQNILNHWLLWHTLFKDFDFVSHRERIYKRGHIPMLAGKFTELTRRERARDWPSIHDVLAAGQPLWDEQDLRRQKAIERKDEKQRLQRLARKEASHRLEQEKAAS